MEFESVKKEEYVKVENKFIRELLDGMLEKGIITSLYGAAGTGKTTFCIQAANEILKEGGRVLYVDTEGGFSIERAKQIMGKDIGRLLIKSVFSFKELQTTIELLREAVKEKDGEGVIIDSMSQPYRVEGGEVQDINKMFSRLFYILAKIAKRNNIPVITTNQVYSDFSSNKLEVVGRDIPKYASKTMIFLIKKDNIRKAILKKHRFLDQKEVEFNIIDKGMTLR